MTQALDIATRGLIAARLAAGTSNKDIAAELGKAHNTISHHAHNPITRALIEQYQQEISDAVMAKVQDSTIDLVKHYHSQIISPDVEFSTDKAKVMFEHGGKLVRGMLQSIGILPSHAPSVMIQQIFSQTQIHLSPAVTEALTAIIAPHVPGQEPDPEE